MPDEIAIQVHHLSKKFAQSLKKAMWYGLVDIARAAWVPHRFRSPHLAARMADAARASRRRKAVGFPGHGGDSRRMNDLCALLESACKAMRTAGMPPLWIDGFAVIQDGLTSIFFRPDRLDIRTPGSQCQ